MRASISIYLYLIVLTLTACGRVTSERLKLDSFIDRYIIISDFAVEQHDERCLRLVFESNGLIYQNSKDGNNSVFKAISKKNGDIGYNTSFSYHPRTGVYGFCVCTDPNISSVNVRAQTKFNATHTKGSDLGDVVRFISKSYNHFIESGYKSTFIPTEENTSDFFRKYINYPSYQYLMYPQFQGKLEFPYFPVDKTLDKVSLADLKMISPILRNEPLWNIAGYLYFEELPDVPGDYDIRVEITDENGKVYTSDLTMKFDF